jgi:anti-sigma factor RsiW
MSTAGGCKMVLLAQADFDGELDAAQAAELETHRAGCPICQSAQREFAGARAALRHEGLYRRAPDSLRRALATRLAAATEMTPVRSVAWWRGPAASAGLGAAAAAAISFLLLWPGQQSIVDQIVDDHVRALQPGHLEDVVSSDRHTVKPWFEGRIDFAPPVKDLADKQFPLKGGRLDYLGGRPVAALVYERGMHVINMFVWPAAGAADSTATVAAHNGYNVIHWVQEGMTIWVVSDLEKAQLADFVRLWNAAS